MTGIADAIENSLIIDGIIKLKPFNDASTSFHSNCPATNV